VLTREQTIAKLNELEKLYKGIHTCFEKIGGVFGRDYFEGSMYEAYTNLVDSYVDTIAECSGISQEALCWWIFDADWGKGNNGVVVGGERDNGVIYLTTNEAFVNFELGE